MSSIGIHGGASGGASGEVEVTAFPDNEPFNLAQYGGTNTTLGQKAAAASVPVVVASDQSALPVTVSSLPNEGQQTMANSISVAVASDQSAIPISAASLPLPSGAATAANQEGSVSAATDLSGAGNSVTLAVAGQRSVGALLLASSFVGTIQIEATIDGTTWIGALIYNHGLFTYAGSSVVNPTTALYTIGLPGGCRSVRIRTSAYTSGLLVVTLSASGSISPFITEPATALSGSSVPLFNNTVGGVVPSSGISVALQLLDSTPSHTSFGTLVRPLPHFANTATVTTVADTASSTQLLAANTSRKGVAIANDSSAALYVKLGTTASTTDYTVRLVQYAYYEVPFHYTGRIDGIWATDPGDGAARITELT